MHSWEAQRRSRAKRDGRARRLVTAISLRWHYADPRRPAAHVRALRALKASKLMRPAACSACGEQGIALRATPGSGARVSQTRRWFC